VATAILFTFIMEFTNLAINCQSSSDPDSMQILMDCQGSE